MLSLFLNTWICVYWCRGELEDFHTQDYKQLDLTFCVITEFSHWIQDNEGWDSLQLLPIGLLSPQTVLNVLIFIALRAVIHFYNAFLHPTCLFKRGLMNVNGVSVLGCKGLFMIEAQIMYLISGEHLAININCQWVESGRCHLSLPLFFSVKILSTMCVCSHKQVFWKVEILHDGITQQLILHLFLGGVN